METIKIIETLNAHTVKKPCVKLTVKAIIVAQDGSIATGDNAIRNDVDVCPRVVKNCPTGQGYEMCKSVCNQNEHAEVTAIQNAKKQGMDIQGATLMLTGHTYCCDNCISSMKEAGITKAVCVDSGKEYLFNQ